MVYVFLTLIENSTSTPVHTQKSLSPIRNQPTNQLVLHEYQYYIYITINNQSICFTETWMNNK